MKDRWRPAPPARTGAWPAVCRRRLRHRERHARSAPSWPAGPRRCGAGVRSRHRETPAHRLQSAPPTTSVPPPRPPCGPRPRRCPRNLERRGSPAEFHARGGNFLHTQRLAMRGLGAGLVGRTKADGRAAADERRLVAALQCRFNGGGHCIRILPVDRAQHVPAIGFEALRRVVAEPAFGVAIDGDVVVVVEGDELVQMQRAGQRAHLVRDAFHHAAVTEEHPGAVIDDVMAGTVELRGQQLLGQRHAHGISDALPERAGSGLDAELRVVLGMSRGVRTQLPEVLQVIDGQRITREMQQRIQQHRCMPVRQHEAIAIRPLRIVRVVLQVMPPQHFCYVGHAHRGTGVAGVGLLDGIHGQGPDGIARSRRVGVLKVTVIR